VTVFSDTTTGTGLLQRLRQRVGDDVKLGSAADTGDGTTKKIKLPDRCINTGSVICTVGGTTKSETTDWTMDYDSGWCTFVSAPAAAAAIIWNYTYHDWSDLQCKEAINSGIDYVGKGFYSIGYDANENGDGSSKDYPLPPNTVKVVKVEVSTTLNDKWDVLPTNQYLVTAHTSDYLGDTSSTILTLAANNVATVTVGDVLKDAAQAELFKVTSIAGDVLTGTRGYRSTTAVAHASAASWTKWNEKVLHFITPPSGAMKITVTKRASHLSAAADTLEYTAGLPERAAEAVILYGCYILLGQHAITRMKDGKYVAEGDIDPSKIRDMATTFKLMADASIASIGMKPVHGRSGH
jgi:hypothetical protein